MVRGAGFNYVVVHPPVPKQPSLFQLFDLEWVASHNLLAAVLHHPVGILEVRSSIEARIKHRSRGYNRYSVTVVPATALDNLPRVPYMVLVTPRDYDERGREYVRSRRDPVLHLVSEPRGDECGHFGPSQGPFEQWLRRLREYFVEAHPDLVEEFDRFLAEPIPAPPTLTKPVWRRQITLPNDLVTVSLGWRYEDTIDRGEDAACASFRSVQSMRNTNDDATDYPPGYTSLLLVSASVVRRLPEIPGAAERRQLGPDGLAAYRQVLRTSGEMDPDLGPVPDDPALRDQGQRMAFERKAELQALLTAAAIEGASQCVPIIAVPSGFRRVQRALVRLDSAFRGGHESYEHVARTATEIGDLMRRQLPACALQTIDSLSGTVKAITDDPIEFVTTEGWPLAGQRPVVRMPATPGFVLAKAVSTCDGLVLHPDDTANVLVLRGTDRTDPVYGILEDVFGDMRRLQPDLNIRIADVASVDDIRRELERREFRIVVVDAHGRHPERQSGRLEIGGVRVSLWESQIRMPPIVLLASCETHPVHRPQDTIAASILSCGARTVVGTFSPVDALQSAAFYGGLLLAIRAKVPELRGPIRWSELFAHFAWSWHVREGLDHLRAMNVIVADDARLSEAWGRAVEHIWTFHRDWRHRVFADLAAEFSMPVAEIETAWRRYAYVTASSMYCQLGQADSIVLTPTQPGGHAPW